MTKRLTITMMLSLMIVSGKISAYDGGDLFEHMNGGNQSQVFALGFITGTAAIYTRIPQQGICLNWPSGVHNNDFFNEIYNFLEQRPEARIAPAEMVVGMALINAYEGFEPTTNNGFCK